MNFGPCAIADAQGAILAHSLRLDQGSFKKGRILSSADIKTLTQAGIHEVIVARLAPDDVLEDEAARQLIALSAGDGVRMSAPFTGRANLYAKSAGLVEIDTAAIDAFNGVDEAITMASLRPFDRVEANQMLATIKIIPFAVSGGALAQAARLCPRLSVRPFVEKKIALISTRLPGMKEALLDKNQSALQGRLDKASGSIVIELRVDHHAEQVGHAITKAIDIGVDLILIFGASAIVDRRDVIPRGIELAGGRVEHFGMPVDPGNLLLLGTAHNLPVIGLPGCARSPKPNGFDWVLERLLCNIALTKSDITRMGAGGLLKEISARPQPRDGKESLVVRAPKVGAVLLAAGRSSRMGPDHKLLQDVDGKPLIRHSIDALVAADLDQIVVVTGHRRDEIAALVAHDPVTTVFNPHFADGMSSSLRAGILALADDVDAILIALGDMPAITADHIHRLIAGFDPVEGRSIVVATNGLKRGNPVLFASRFRPELIRIQGDTGARHLIGDHRDEVVEVDLGPGAMIDLDTPEALAAYRARHDP